MKYEINIPFPSWFEIFLARVFGEKYCGQCMDSYVEGYKWRGETYITRSWTDTTWTDKTSTD